MHMCTHLPPDPAIILAMEITEKNYDTYLNMPAETHIDLETIKGNYVIVSVDQPVSWGWVSKELFENFYVAMQPWFADSFTLCTIKK